MTGDEPQGTMGRVQTAVSPVVSFPPSFARTFSSKERRLGTRQSPIRYGFFIGTSVNIALDYFKRLGAYF